MATLQNFDAEIEKTKQVVEEMRTKIEQSGTMLDKFAQADQKIGEADFDIENARIQDVLRQQKVMEGNIADLIIGLEDATNVFGSEFESMKTYSGFEKLIGMFSKQRMQRMRSERVRNMSLAGNLQELLAKSDTIVGILTAQKEILDTRYKTSEESLRTVIERRKTTMAELEATQKRIEELNPALMDIENKIAATTNQKDRTDLESQRSQLATDYNQAQAKEQELLAASQTLERYTSMFQTFVDSLNNQIAAQNTLINKLTIDTEQRIVLYKALEDSLKTAAQLENIHGVYIPAWTFDAQSYSQWEAESGEYYYEDEEYEAEEDGKMVVRTKQVRKTRWRDANGERRGAYDDWLIQASKGLDQAALKGLLPFDLGELKAYDAAYLSGMNAERYAVGLDDAWAIAQKELFERALEVVEGGQSLRSVDWKGEERELLRPLFLITIKPVLYVANVADDDLDGRGELASKVAEYAAATGADFVALSGDIEGELAGMDPEEREEFQADLGITEPGLDRLARQAYHLLGLQTYFTAGPKEIRAWTIHAGDKAPRAAGVIHTDFEKGFIRAECYSVDDLEQYQTEAAIRDAGKLRVEGKEYVMQEGDVVHFLFNR